MYIIVMSFEYRNPDNMMVYNDHYYLFCKNINPSLQKELGIQVDATAGLKSDWKPPSTYGLDNSKRVIPEHYFDTKFKEIDMYYEITKDIRNLHPLSEIQLDYIKTLPKENIIELLDIYNICLKTISSFLQEL